jgi:hypothetical protein
VHNSLKAAGSCSSIANAGRWQGDALESASCYRWPEARRRRHRGQRRVPHRPSFDLVASVPSRFSCICDVGTRGELRHRQCVLGLVVLSSGVEGRASRTPRGVSRTRRGVSSLYGLAREERPSRLLKFPWLRRVPNGRGTFLTLLFGATMSCCSASRFRAWES